MKKTAIAAALLLASTGAAQAATITSLDVSGGFFGMNDPINASGDESVIGAFTLDMGVYQDSITTWAFGFFGNVTNYTSAQCADRNADTVPDCAGGGAAPSGTVDGAAGTIDVDMSSWFAFWNGNDFNQGAQATGTYDEATGAFTLNWSSTINGGPFDGATGFWQLSGTANVEAPSSVPVPAAVWLMGSGLIGLAGVARRRKAA